MRFDLIDPEGLNGKIRSGEVRSMNQTLMGDAEICLRRSQYGLTGKWDASEASIVGSAVHSGLECHYRARMNGETASRDDVMSWAKSEFDGECEHIEEGFEWETSKRESWARVVRFLGAYFGNGWNWPSNYQVIGVEQKLVLPFVPGWATSATIDLVLRSPESDLILVDHKTAGRKWHAKKGHPRQRAQAPWYLWVYWRHTGEMGKWAYDVMWTTKKDVRHERRWAPCTTEEILGTVQKAKTLARSLDLLAPRDVDPSEWDLPGNTTSLLCSERWCRHWVVCPFGATMAGTVVLKSSAHS